ncbi:MAG: P-loop NTPase [Deferribacteraceae bacterium]|jgi:flagellar biosynthesis protein FlhG|nr:P-loop NTPase [Deferribacteraceae bacterium]
MSEIIAIASGKGGVGKSFLASCLAISLAALGEKILLVDADLGGANLHNFLGYKFPPTGLYNFLREKFKIDEIITKTDVGIDFIAGSGDVLGMAHITKAERQRFIDKVAEYDYKYVILDLGAGTSYNMVDLFNLAAKKIMAMNSEPTAIENAYGFLKVAAYRYIERFLAADSSFQDVSRRLRNKSVSYKGLDDVVQAVREVNPDKAVEIDEFANAYKIGITLNMVRFKKELNVFYGFETVVKKYLKIQVEKLGFIPFDNKVGEAVRLMQPFYYNNRSSAVAACIDDIRDALLKKL